MQTEQCLKEYIFPVKTILAVDVVYQAKFLSLAEMINSGPTDFYDRSLFAKDAVLVTDESGMKDTGFLSLMRRKHFRKHLFRVRK